MTPLQAIALGIIQGLSEFLPISSSAHLALAALAFGWEDPASLSMSRSTSGLCSRYCGISGRSGRRSFVPRSESLPAGGSRLPKSEG